MVCVGRKAQVLARRGRDIRAGNHPSRRILPGASFQAQVVQPGVDEGGEYPAQPGTAQRVEVLIPAAVLHVMQAVLNAPVVAEHLKQFLRPALPGTQAGQQIPAPPAHLPGGYVHALLLHHRPLPSPGKSQLIPDAAGQQGIGPNPPSLDRARFFSGSPPAGRTLPPGQTRRLMPPSPQAGSP